MGMSDDGLASAIAAELGDHLRGRARAVAGPVYAVSLWSCGDYGELGVSLATEGHFQLRRQAPVYHDVSDDGLSAPTGLRWDTGDWDVVAEPFVSEQTQRKLNALGAAIEQGAAQAIDDPKAVPGLVQAWRRWISLSNMVMSQTRPLELLDCTPDAVCYVELESFGKRVEHAMSMILTSDRAVLRRQFPHWARLCAALNSTDAGTRARLGEISHQPSTEAERLYRETPLPSGTQRLLADCGFTWRDVASWDGARIPSDFDPEIPNFGTEEPMALAFVVADRLG
jgi:hypothetical protein